MMMIFKDQYQTAKKISNVSKKNLIIWYGNHTKKRQKLIIKETPLQ